MNPTRKMLKAIVAAYDRMRDDGGNLHMLLNNTNYEDRHVEFCRKQALDDGDAEGVWLADLFLAMTVRERIELHANPNAQLELLEEQDDEAITREYVLERRAHWVAEKERNPLREQHYTLVHAIESCDDWLNATAFSDGLPDVILAC